MKLEEVKLLAVTEDSLLMDLWSERVTLLLQKGDTSSSGTNQVGNRIYEVLNKCSLPKMTPKLKMLPVGINWWGEALISDLVLYISELYEHAENWGDLDADQKHSVAFRSNPSLFEVEYIFKSETDGRVGQDI